jgi:hypothetical protein
LSNVRFQVVVSNAWGSSAPSALLTVLPDADRDGLPDAWELAHPGFNPNDPADGARDDDGDGMTNGEEYLAGTDYLNPASYLRIQLVPPGPTNLTTLRFNAVSNRTYTVQLTDGLAPLPWRALGYVIGRRTNRVEVLVDPTTNASRFYRVVTPAQP